MFCSFDKVDFFKQTLEKYFNLKNIIIWVKNNWTAGDLEAQFGKQYEMLLLGNKGRSLIQGKRISDVWETKRVAGNAHLHQNQKPLDLIKRCIEKHSNLNNLVLDPFMGSWTTAQAASELDRNFIGSELSKDYCEIGEKRLRTVQKSLF